MDQGLVKESLNLAAVRKLPMLFICKDNQRTSTKLSSFVTCRNQLERADSFDMNAEEVDRSDALSDPRLMNGKDS